MKSRFLLALMLALPLALMLALLLPVPASSTEATTAGSMWRSAFFRASLREEAVEEFRSGTELHCAHAAQRRDWCSLYCFEDTMCQLYNVTHPASRPNDAASGVACKTTAAVRPLCPDPFDSVPFLTDLGCLYRDDERRSWDAARNNCIALGGDLFVPAHSEQFIALNSYLFSKGYTAHRWVGLFSSTWIDGRPENDVWNSTEPNHNGDCGLMDPGHLLFDRACDKTYSAICQK
nr:uncharacterized protein LOC113801942 [Penaeus vannamei]